MKKRKRLLALFLTLVMTFTTVFGLQSIAAPAVQTDSSEDNVLKLTMDETGYLTPTAESQNKLEDLENKKFSWDNATVYFVLTDRFKNGDTSNDHSYGRGLTPEGKPVEGLDSANNPGTFHGGDLKGMTEVVEDGYFNELGVNAIWITAPYEQIHGYTSGNKQSNNANTYPDPDRGGFPYYSYHGYWTLDYSQIDANMGSEEDFEKFCDACHSHGIRVVMDVVMNHVGYVTMQDAVDYGFDGALKGDWKTYYYGNSTYLMGGDPESENYWDKTSSVWSKWWGPAFVKADYPGYTAAGGGDIEMSLCGLPDVMTSKSAPEGDTPPLLVNKWTKEGRLSKEQGELDSYFSRTGNKKQARYYIIKWLTDWVREYGVDGFRCDTAKHVDMDAWNDLKKEAVEALKEWRKNNPDKPGAQWTDDFWMTGEAWGHGMGRSSYYDNGFDSMINFDFPKGGSPSSMEGTYSKYANDINSDPTFNSLSYISSHDDCLTRGNMIDAGTDLLLTPGAAQIYYGDESNRPIGWNDWFTSDYKDQRYRTDMNWDSIDQKVLSHWQKVGQFRNNHLSVGAGQHEKLSDSPYTFARTYHLEEDDEDKVVVAVPGTAGTHEINVGDVFEDGETITDAYSGEKYTVSSGSVSATCDANGVILLEGSGIVKASLNAKTKNKASTYSSDTFDITLRANKAKDTYYSINGGEKVAYKSDDILTIGQATAYGEKTEITLYGTSEDDGSELEKKFTYQRSKEPTVSDGVFCVKVKKSDFSTAPNIFVYTNDTAETALNGAWPGGVMTEDEDSEYWSFSSENITGDACIILSLGATSNSGGTWRSTPDKAKGLVAQGSMLYDKTGNNLTELPSGDPGKVTIKYLDQKGTILKEIYRVGVIGKKYTTYPADEGAWDNFSQYTLTEKPSNATGVFEKESEVTYVYSSGGVIITKITAGLTNPNETYTYNGTEHKPEVTVKDGPNPLREGTDYTVSYENNVNAGDKSSDNAPSVTISGMGSYANADGINTTLKFTIDKAEIPEKAPTNAMKVSTGKLSDVAVLNGSWSWSDEDKVKDVNAGETITVTAVYNGSDKDNYKKTSVTVDVTGTDCKHDGGTTVENAVEATCGKAGYSGDTYCSDCHAIIKSGEVTEATGKHSWDEGVEQGDKKIYTCTVCGNTTTTIIEQPDTVTVSLEDTQFVYDGTPKTPKVTVKSGTTTLKNDIDYTVTYRNNTDAGDMNAGDLAPAVIVTCKGNYEGTFEKTFTIKKAAYPKSGKPGTTMNVSKDFEKVSDIKDLPEGWVWDSADADKTLGEQPIKATAIYNKDDKKNYETVSVEVSITKSSHCSHPFGNVETKNSKNATCTGKGYTGDMYCTNCQTTVQSGTEIPALGHSWSSWKVTKQPTATAKGMKTRQCTICTENEEVQFICDYQYPTAAHVWDGGKVTKQPTATANGEKTYTCNVCSAARTETVPATGGGGSSQTTGEDPKKPTPIEPTPAKEGTITTDKSVKKGTIVTDSASKTTYRVTATATKTAEYVVSGSNSKVITVPDKIVINNSTYKVTSVASEAFEGNTKITGIVIGKNVKTIGRKAFSGCKNLKEVAVSSNVTTIGDNAFYKCTKLTSITIPSKVSKIGKKAFYGCKNLKKITIKTTKLTDKKIGSSAFKGINSKATIKVPKKKLSSYKKLLNKKGAGSKVNIKK